MGRFATSSVAAGVAIGVLTIGSARLAPTLPETLRLVEDWRWERRGYAVRVLARTILLSGRHEEGLPVLRRVAANDAHPRVQERARTALRVLTERKSRAPNWVPELPP